MLDAAKLLTRITQKMNRKDSRITTSPRIDTHRRNRRPRVAVIEHGQDDRRKKREEDQRHDDFLGPLPLILRPGLHPTLKERSVVDRQVHGEADGRRGKDPQEQPALPVVERAGRPEDEDDKEEGPEHSLNNRLSVERIHIRHQAGTIVARRSALSICHEAAR